MFSNCLGINIEVMTKTKFLSVLGIIPICLMILSFLSCDNKKKEINKQLTKIYSHTIRIPFYDMDTLIIDSGYISKKADHLILVYIDSTECTSCYASHHTEWKRILDECKKYTSSITLSIIIETKRIPKDVEEEFLMSQFGKSIFIDKNGVFRKRNPDFPESRIMHVLLLDKNDKIVLIGSPLSNKKIEKILYDKLRAPFT